MRRDNMCKKQRNQSRAFVVSNKAKKRLSGLLAGVMLVGGLLTPKYEAEAHRGYFLAILPDVESFSYQSLIIEDNANAESGHKEFSYINGAVVGADGKRLPTNGYEGYLDIEGASGLTKGSVNEETGAFEKLGISGDFSCFYTFPTCSSSGNWFTKGKDYVLNLVTKTGDATNLDREAASNAGRELTTGVNTALAYILRTAVNADGSKWVYSSIEDKTERHKEFIRITTDLANAARDAVGTPVANKPLVVGKTTYTFKMLSSADKTKAGLTSAAAKQNKYVRIKADNDSSEGVIFQYSTLRYPTLAAEEGAERGGGTKTLTVYNIVALGNMSFIYGGVTSTEIENVFEPSWIENILIDLLNNMLSGLRSLLGLQTMGELVFNDGTYGSTTYKGLAPISWFQAADVLFWTSQAFAWLLLILASLKFIGTHMWSTVTPMQRVSLMNGIQNLLITAFCLSLIVPIFNILAEFNYLIIGVLRDTSIFNDNLVNGNAFPNTLSGIILAFFYFGSEMIINFMYILRGATICLLYGTSPLFVVAFAFGGRFQGITLRFVKELVGNIFVQLFHAIIFTFYGLYIFTGSSGNFFVSLVMIFAIIPMTKVFKTITGIGESDFIQGVAEQAKGVVENSAKGAANVGLSTFKSDHKRGYSGPTGSGDSQTNPSTTGPTPNGPVLSGPTPGNGGDNDPTKDLNSPENNKSVEGTFTKPVSLGEGGGAVNSFGNAELSSSTPELENSSKLAKFGRLAGKATAKTLKGAGRTLRGTAAVAAGMALGAAGGAFGISGLTGLGQDLAKKGGKDFKRNLTSAGHYTQKAAGKVGDYASAAKDKILDFANDKWGGQDCSLDVKSTDFDLNGKANSQIHTYNGRTAANKNGIVDMYQTEIDGQQSLVQEFDASLLAEDGALFDLSQISFDESTGRVTDELALAQGITHISKLENGNYRVALDMQKIGVKEVRKAGNGSRYQVKTEVDKGRSDMNYLANPLNEYSRKVAEKKIDNVIPGPWEQNVK